MMVGVCVSATSSKTLPKSHISTRARLEMALYTDNVYDREIYVAT